jgi:hypothetical protein
MQLSGYVLLALTFVGLSFSLRKRWARVRRFDHRGWRLFHGCLGSGVQPPAPSWGGMIRDATRYMLVALIW